MLLFDNFADFKDYEMESSDSSIQDEVLNSNANVVEENSSNASMINDDETYDDDMNDQNSATEEEIKSDEEVLIENSHTNI